MFFRRHKKLLGFIYILLIISCTGVIGYIIAQNEPRVAPSTDSGSAPEVLMVGVDDASITKDTMVSWDYEYEKCAHHIYVRCQADENMVGLTFSTFAQHYPNVKVIQFDTDELVLSETFSSYCPDHFVIKKYEDALAIFRTALGSDKQDHYLDVPIVFEDLHDDEQKVLSVGKVFNSLEEVESYLEDLET